MPVELERARQMAEETLEQKGVEPPKPSANHPDPIQAEATKRTMDEAADRRERLERGLVRGP